MTDSEKHSRFWDTLHKYYIISAVFISPVLSQAKHIFGFPAFEYFDLSLIAFIFLTIGLVWIFILRKIKTNIIQPFYQKTWFLTLYCVLTLVAYGNFLFICGSKFAPIEKKQQAKTRIVIMLPLGENVRPSYLDGMRQVYGYAEFLTGNNNLYNEDFEFVPFDHMMNYTIAKKIIEDEVNKGTKYFISTMSKVNEELSKRFEEIIANCKYTGVKPVLVCTITSSPKITLKANAVYRFYVRSQEEGRCLADLAISKELKSVTYIVVNDPYGQGAIEEFKKNWTGSGKFTEGIKVDYTAEFDDISEQVEKNIKSIPEADRQAIFIAHYGNGIDKVIRALNKANIKAVILATSTLSIHDWQEPIQSVLSKYEWHTCIPKYTSPDAKQQDDVIKNFATHTLKRLVQTINFVKGNPGSTFNDYWQKAEVYTGLDIAWDGNGDAVIPMRAVDSSYFKK